MILSEKITELRKKNGLSQEALGEKLGVSRQAVSKWEMAQSVPDLNKIIAMAEVFGVSTDLLLLDELDLTEIQPHNSRPVSESLPPARTVTLEEANGYLAASQRAARLASLASMLVLLSPVAGIMLSALTAGNEAAGMTGAVTEVLILIGSAVLLILSLNCLSGYKHLKKEPFELGYGVTGAVNEKKQNFAQTRLIGLIAGIALCLGSVIPMMVCSMLSDSDIAVAASGCIMLLMAACGIAVILYGFLINRGFSRLLNKQK